MEGQNFVKPRNLKFRPFTYPTRKLAIIPLHNLQRSRMREIVKKFVAGDADIIFARLSVIIVLAVMGNYKWFEFEVEALKPLFSQTWLSFLPSALGDAGASYFLGVVETVGYLSLIAGFFKPKAGIVGDLIVIVMAFTTLSLLPQLGKIDGFIFKDLFLLGLGLVLLKYDLARLCRGEKSCD